MKCYCIPDSPTTAELFYALSLSGYAMTAVRGTVGILRGIEREDGSGRSFNVTLADPASGQVWSVYVRCRG